MAIKFELKNDEEITVIKNGEVVGQIFTPGGTGKDNIDCIQVCGFSDMFEYWGCGVFKGFKDIGLNFSDRKMKGKFNCFKTCTRCYHDPCQCKDELVLHRRKKDMIAHNVAKEV